jgi:glucosamine--fructose-6-phosphate aminotransferase (isomerizing)
MCGIVGYIGKNDGAGAVVAGLKSLEYRGYDSWGIAAKSSGKVTFHKQVGRIGGFNLKKDLPGFSGQICIGHTRWATHGGVTKENSHPHFSCDKKVFVCHNGIIENYQELREELEKRGHKFASQTDTEAIAHLIEENLKTKKFPEAVRAALKRLEGSYAVVAIDQDSEQLVGARFGSPLVLGVGDKEFFLASDVPAFLEHTNKVVFIDEMQMVQIDAEGFKLMNVESGKEIKPKIAKIEWSLEAAQMGGYPHFMIKEMLEQPDVIEKTAGMDSKELEKAAQMIKSAKRVFIVACGTALHAGIYGQYLLAQ